MFLLLALIPLALARDIPTIAFPEDLTVDPRVIGGSEVNPVGKYPWQGSLVYVGSHTCGCVLISGTLVLTAAHCVEGRPVNTLTVILGAHDRVSSSPGQPETYNLVSVTLHEDYNNGDATFAHDIAVLVLSEPANEDGNDFIEGISFARSGDFAGQTCDYSGWGRTGTSSQLPLLLQEAQTTVMSNDDCQSAVAGIGVVNSGHVCIFTGENGACHGDSGGPLVCNQNGETILVGLTSWIIQSGGNCQISYPSVYNRVSDYADWIDDNSPLS